MLFSIFESVTTLFQILSVGMQCTVLATYVHTYHQVAGAKFELKFNFQVMVTVRYSILFVMYYYSVQYFKWHGVFTFTQYLYMYCMEPNHTIMFVPLFLSNTPLLSQ